MAEHRIRLDDEDIMLLISGLLARRAMTEGLRRHRIDRLVTRLREGLPGNPKWRLDEWGQTHEAELDAQTTGETLTGEIAD